MGAPGGKLACELGARGEIGLGMAPEDLVVHLREANGPEGLGEREEESVRPAGVLALDRLDKRIGIEREGKLGDAEVLEAIILVEHLVHRELAGLGCEARLEAHAFGEQMPPGDLASLGAQGGIEGARRRHTVQQAVARGGIRRGDHSPARRLSDAEHIENGRGVALPQTGGLRLQALPGALAVGEGGPELVKQILNQTYDIKRPEVVAVYLRGSLKKGVGPQDVAIALCGAVFKTGFVKNKILEFIGPGIKNLSMDYRNGIDVMTTETACLSSVWETDEKTREYYEVHGRAQDYKELRPSDPAYYDSGIVINLSTIEPMIALPFHPSNAFTIREFLERPREILEEVESVGKKLRVLQKIFARVAESLLYAFKGFVQDIHSVCVRSVMLGRFANMFGRPVHLREYLEQAPAHCPVAVRA